MAELNSQLQPVIQAMGELFQAGRADLAGREERKMRGQVAEQLMAASRHTDGCSYTSTRAWIQDMDLAAERVGQNGIVDVVTQNVQGALRHALEALIRSVPLDSVVMCHGETSREMCYVISCPWTRRPH